MKTISRRTFLISGLCSLISAPCVHALDFNELKGFKFDFLKSGPEDIRGTIFKNDAPDTLGPTSREAFTYTTLSGQLVRCDICPNQCILDHKDRSVCRTKVNLDGRLYTLAYGNPCAIHVDPIEKKPLFHFKPETQAYSIATAGCNFRCLNCQNWEISQAKPHEVNSVQLFPDAVVKEALKAKAQSVAYTYSEASTYFEYMLDTARFARENNLCNLYISNGYINPGPLAELCKVLDAANINLKSYSDDIYKKLNGGRLQPVLDTLKTLHERQVHLEITHLLVPGYTDDEDMLKRMCEWITTHVGVDHPLHFLRFFPQYKLDRLPPTPVDTLSRFRNIAMEMGIRYVYVGNVPDHDGSHTYCHQCKKRIIERNGYSIGENHIANGQCTFCQTPIPGVWDI